MLVEEHTPQLQKLLGRQTMKTLPKVALLAAIAAASSANADMIAMDDETLGATVGQAGLTIQIDEAEISIGAIDYKDGGFISIKDVVLTGGTGAFGGAGDGILNNITMTVDVAGPDTNQDLGTSRRGEAYIEQAALLVGGAVSGNYVNQTISDGDLVISILATDSTNLLQSVDFSLSIGSIGLGDSTQQAGSVTDGTVLLSDLSLNGYLGPVDIIIDGNDGGINMSAYFNAEGKLSLPFASVTTDFSIHNSRGDDVVWLGTQDKGNSMAHAQVNISKAVAANGTEGLAFDIQNLEADIDLENFALGGAGSGAIVGDLYFTDVHMKAKTVVFGH